MGKRSGKDKGLVGQLENGFEGFSSEVIIGESLNCSLMEIAQTTSGGTPDRKRSDFYGGDIPWVKSGELNDSYIFQTEETLTAEGLKHSSAKLFPAGTLLIAMYGATVGKTAILGMEAATNQAICAIFPDNRKADNDFLRYFLIGEREELLKRRYGGAQPNISQNVILNFPIRLPSLPEQRKIAHILITVQRAIEQQERIIQVTTELKKALMQKVFTEGLRGEPQKQTEIGPVPESWEIGLFHKFVSITNGQVDPTESPYSEMIHVGPENIQSGTGQFLNLRTNREFGIKSGNYYFSPDDVLYSKIRPYLNKVATPYFEGTCSADMYPLRASEDHLVKEYLFQLLLSDNFNKQAISFQDRTGIPKINRAQLGSILLPKPGRDEQIEIAQTLSVLDKRINESQQIENTLNDLFHTFLHQLMAAKIRVPEFVFT